MKRKIAVFVMIVVGMVALSTLYYFNGINKSDKSSSTEIKKNDKKEDVKEEKKVDVALPSWGNSTEALPPEIHRILEKKEIVFGVYFEDSPPFFMTDKNGELYGSDIKLAKDFANEMKVNYKFERSAKTYDELVEQVASGKVDMVISCLSRTIERSKLVKFSKPYIKLRKAVFVNKVQAVKNKIEESPIENLINKRFKIGVVKGTSYQEFSESLFKKGEIILYDTWEEVLKELIKGNIMATMYDECEIVKEVRQNPDIALYTSVFVLKDQKDDISVAVNWKDTHLLSWINTFLETYDIEYNVNSLIEQYPEVFEEKKDKK